MVHSNVQVLLLILVALMGVAVGKTPPGIAKNPSHATCKIKKYKHCYNLVHVCPKFCPDSCIVECASCKPICGGGGGAENPPLPSTPATPTPYPPPTTPATTKPSPPPTTPSTPKPSPPPSTPSPATPTPSPPLTTPTSPATPTPTPSPPPTTPSTPSAPTPSPPPSTPSSPSTPTLSPPPTPPSSPATPKPSPPPSTPSTPATPTPHPPPTTPSSPSTPTPYPAPTTPSTPSTPASSPPPSTPSSPSTPPPSAPSSPSTPPPSTPSSPSTPTPSSPSTPTPSSPPPRSSRVSGSSRARCRNKNYPQCYNMEHVCPKACPGGCEVDCVTCKPVCKCDRPGAVCQDPRFIGGDGITFYFHGKKDSNFCLVSDPNLHINAHFIGKRNHKMKRDFTWVQSIAILFGNQQVFIDAQKTTTWDDSVDRLAIAFNGSSVTLPASEGSRWQSTSAPSVSIVRDANTNSAIIEIQGRLRITAKVVPITEEDSRIHNYGIKKEDCFAHLDLSFKFFSLSNEVSGVLGQTYRPDYVSRVDLRAKMPVMGGNKEFETTSLFAADCSVARFVGFDNEVAMGNLELPSLSCASGIDGQGVVRKR